MGTSRLIVIVSGVAILCAGRPLAAQTPVLYDQQVLTAQLAVLGDFVGSAVALSGDGNTMAVGAPRSGYYMYWPTDEGAVYIFERNPATGAWGETARLTSGGWPPPPDHFGAAVALSEDGHTVVVGAPGAQDAPAAYVFQRTVNSWTMVQTLFEPDLQFGASIALRGSTLLVAAPVGGGHPPGGAVFVYRAGATGWTRTAVLKASDAVGGDQFGASISINETEDTIVVGAPRESEPDDACRIGTVHPGCERGAGYVFQLNGSTGQWQEVIKLTASRYPTLGHSAFGTSVAISGNTAVFGAPGSFGGTAYVFRGPSWQEVARLIPLDIQSNDAFGTAVAIWGPNILAGAPDTDGGCVGSPWGGCYSGSVYLFQPSGSSWAETKRLAARDAARGRRFGWALSMIGTHIAVGAPSFGSTVVGSEQIGRAYSFTLGAAPDFVQTFVTDPPASVRLGDPLSVTDTVANRGTAPGNWAARTRYYLSADQRRDARDGYLGAFRYTSGLAAGASSTGNPSGVPTVPALPQGTYFLLACADADNQNVESDESNNCIASSGRTVVTGADLVVSSMTNPPATAVLGATLSITDTVTNQGTEPAGASTVRYFLSLDTIRDAGDVQLTGSRSVGSLTPSAGSTGPVTLTIPATSGGEYYVLACADAQGAVPETDEGNNCRRSSARVRLSGPNLVVWKMSNPPAAILVGAQFSVTEYVEAQYAATGAFRVRFYMSIDTVKDPTDVVVAGSRAVPALGAWDLSWGTTVLTVPTLPAGNYRLLACADADGTVPEINETDNCLAAVAGVMVSGPDLTESSVGNPPSVAYVGGSFSIADTASNQGNAAAGPFTIRYYLSRDASRSSSDILLSGSRTVDALASGASSPGTVTLGIPAPIYQTGSFFVLACADALGGVVETDEKNNCRSSQTTVDLTYQVEPATVAPQFP